MSTTEFPDLPYNAETNMISYTQVRVNFFHIWSLLFYTL